MARRAGPLRARRHTGEDTHLHQGRVLVRPGPPAIDDIGHEAPPGSEIGEDIIGEGVQELGVSLLGQARRQLRDEPIEPHRGLDAQQPPVDEGEPQGYPVQEAQRDARAGARGA